MYLVYPIAVDGYKVFVYVCVLGVSSLSLLLLFMSFGDGIQVDLISHAYGQF